MTKVQWKGEEAAEYTTRLLSGSAYRRGIFGALELLNNLRSDRYKARSPESRLDLERIALHAIQSVTISALFSAAAIALFLIQLSFISFTLAGIPTFLIIDLIGAIAMAYELFYLRWSIARKFLKQSYNKSFQPNLPFFREFCQPLSAFFKRHIIKPEPTQNVIVSGSYTPFLGAGGQISRWTLAIDRKPVEADLSTSTRINIPVEEFYKAVDQEVAILELPNLRGLSRLFVDGFELEADGKILANPKAPPEAFISEEEIWKLGQDGLGKDCRAYRLYQYTDTARDQVLSYFLRFYSLGSITFVECSTHILPSIDRRRFSLTPVLKDGKASRLLKTSGVALLLLLTNSYILVALAYLFIFARNIIAWRLDDAKQLRAANLQEEYNYGLTQTFRESIAARNYESYYGVQDLTMYWKSIQEATLSGLVQLLKRYNVDTSQFEQAASSIINTGIMVSGGNFSATQVAAGQGASAQMNNGSQQQPNLLQQIKVAAD